MATHHSDDTPVLITEAAPSYDDQYRARRKKYAIIMSLRIPCLILGGIFVNTPWLAISFVVLSVPLPWVAVLIANDRPPRKAEEVNRYAGEQQRVARIESRDHQVIEGGD